jgi:uncharacterized protein DUF5908
MPLEINEIDIAMVVTDDERWPGGDREGAGAPAAEIDREELIEECVRRVLQALKGQGEP